MGAMPAGMPMGMPAPAAGSGMSDGGAGAGDFPQIDMGTPAPVSGMRYIPSGPLPPTPSGYVPGAPIIATPALGEGLARLQAGETGFEVIVGGGLGRTPFIGKTIKPFLPKHDLLSYVEAIMRTYNQYGRRDNI